MISKSIKLKNINKQFDDVKVVHSFNLNIDAGEFVTVEKIPIKKLLSMIKSGKILDSKTICATMIYATKTNILK